MYGNRYIKTKALKLKDSTYVPFWELTYCKSKDFGEGFEYKNHYKTSYNELVDCYWDTKKHELLLGIVKDVYPDKSTFEKEENVYVEVNHSTYKSDKIVDIEFKEYDSEIITLSKLIDSKRFDILTNEEKTSLDSSIIFELRHWKPIYILESGIEIKWDYMLKHVAK